MVKNTTGGSKQKGMARKLQNAPVSNTIPRLNDDDECYAKVTKMCGNGMCYVDFYHKDISHTQQICHIRGKFRSRNKKQNFVQVNSIVIVGVRSWTGKFDTDLLHVVPMHVNTKHINVPSSGTTSSFVQDDEEDDEFEFSANATSHTNMSAVENEIVEQSVGEELDLDAI